MPAPETMQHFAPPKHFSTEQVIFNQGDSFENIYLIQKGMIKLTRVNADGKQFIIRVAISGSILGARTLLMKDTFGATATCLSDCELVCIPKDDFSALLKKDDNVLAYFLKDVGQQIEFSHQLHNVLIQKTNQEKVAELLIVFAHLYGESQSSGEILITPALSLRDFSEISSIPYDNLTRVFSNLRKNNLIEYGDGKLKLLAPNEISKHSMSREHI